MGVVASVALTVNVVVPAVAGVPLIVPVAASVSPAGSEPEVMVQRSGAACGGEDLRVGRRG